MARACASGPGLCVASRRQQGKRPGHASKDGQTGPLGAKTTQKLRRFDGTLVFIVFSLFFIFKAGLSRFKEQVPCMTSPV